MTRPRIHLQDLVTVVCRVPQPGSIKYTQLYLLSRVSRKAARRISKPHLILYSACLVGRIPTNTLQMTRTALVTGSTGLLGRQVVHAFKSAGWNAVGTGLTRANPPAILKVNLTDPVELSTVLQEVK